VTDVRVRDAREDEREAIRELTLAAYRQYAELMPPDAWAGLERAVLGGLASAGNVQRLVAERDGRLLGSVLLYPPAADAYGDMAGRSACPEARLWAVAPGARGQGVGRLLMDECVRRARASGATELGVHTSATMQTALAMYLRMGFRRVPEDDFQPPGAELVEAYRLPLRQLA
jgi:GNAT superfamily N-acetyltransferase